MIFVEMGYLWKLKILRRGYDYSYDDKAKAIYKLGNGFVAIVKGSLEYKFSFLSSIILINI